MFTKIGASLSTFEVSFGKISNSFGNIGTLLIKIADSFVSTTISVLIYLYITFTPLSPLLYLIFVRICLPVKIPSIAPLSVKMGSSFTTIGVSFAEIGVLFDKLPTSFGNIGILLIKIGDSYQNLNFIVNLRSFSLIVEYYFLWPGLFEKISKLVHLEKLSYKNSYFKVNMFQKLGNLKEMEIGCDIFKYNHFFGDLKLVKCCPKLEYFSIEA